MLQRHSNRISTIKNAANLIEEENKRHEESLAAIRSENEKALADLLATREALREVFNKVYHKEIFPEVCRGEGIFTVIETYADEGIINADMASRPNHYRYNEMVKLNLQNVKKWSHNGASEMRKLKNRFQEIMVQYEEYQA